MKDWYKEWFSTDEYLKVYEHRDISDAQKLIELILNNIELKEHADILDIACGSGRHSQILAEKKYKITAFDLSLRQLKFAKENALKGNLKIDFINLDIKNFFFKKKFDLIVNLFTSFGYFENEDDNFKLFPKVISLLNKNGHFVFDYFNKKFIENNLYNDEAEKENIIIKQKRFINNNRIIKEIDILNKEANTVQTFYESVALYSPEIIIDRISNCGFNIKLVSGNYNGDKFNDQSPRLIILASL